MASISKREIKYKIGKDGNVRKGIVFDVYYSYTNPKTGKLKRTSKKGFKTNEDAKTFLIETEYKKQQGTFRKKTRVTLKDFTQKWLVMKKQSIATGTYINYESYTRKHIVPHIGGIYLDELNTDNIIRLRSELLKPEYKLSNSAINKTINTLKAVLSYAVKQRLIVYNVAADIDPLKYCKKDVPIYNVDQIKTLFQYIKDTDLECPICLGVFCGMRRGEVHGLKWSDIDEDAKTIRVQKQVALTDEGYQLKELKTKSSKRIINIPAAVIDILHRQKERQVSKKLEIGKDYNENNLVCCNHEGKIMDTKYFSEKFVKMIKRHKLPFVTFHGMRHSYGTLMMNNNISIKTISNLLGHARISTTADIYIKVDDERKVEAASIIDEIFTSKEMRSEKSNNNHLQVLKMN